MGRTIEDCALMMLNQAKPYVEEILASQFAEIDSEYESGQISLEMAEAKKKKGMSVGTKAMIGAMSIPAMVAGGYYGGRGVEKAGYKYGRGHIPKEADSATKTMKKIRRGDVLERVGSAMQTPGRMVGKGYGKVVEAAKKLRKVPKV